MRRVMLLRHAKSSWDDPSLTDHDRPLAPRGIAAARRMGAHLRHSGAAFDLALVSTARRAQETYGLLMEGLDADAVRSEHESGLYLCGPERLLQRLRKLPPEVGTVLVVAHNPDLEMLAQTLIARAPADDDEAERIDRLREKYATANLAIIDLPADGWGRLGTHTGRLTAFLRPADLAEPEM